MEAPVGMMDPPSGKFWTYKNMADVAVGRPLLKLGEGFQFNISVGVEDPVYS